MALGGLGETSLGITVLGRRLGILEDALLIAVLGLYLLSAAERLMVR